MKRILVGSPKYLLGFLGMNRPLALPDRFLRGLGSALPGVALVLIELFTKDRSQRRLGRECSLER